MVGCEVRRNGRAWQLALVIVLRTLTLFVLAAFAEISGAWLVWQGVREHRGVLWIAGGCSRWARTALLRRCSRMWSTVGGPPILHLLYAPPTRCRCTRPRSMRSPKVGESNAAPSRKRCCQSAICALP